jgi:hypothetical protein
MDINAIVVIAETHAEPLARKWLERLHREEGMERYLLRPEAELLQHVRAAYEEIGTYLDQPRHMVIAEHFRSTGRRRRAEGVPLAQVVRAVQIARIVLWQYVIEEGIFDSTANLYQGLNLYRQIVNFFDGAVLYAVEGYTEEPST